MTDSAPPHQAIIDFPTAMVATAVMIGGSPEGRVQFTFFTEGDGPDLRTIIGPNLTKQILQSLVQSLESIPSLNGLLGLKVPVKKNTSSTGSLYFGQSYPTEILLALGVLVVRVNLLEKNLVRLLSILMLTDYEKAEALFYSTANSKARIDMIRAVHLKCNLTETTKIRVAKCLDTCNSIAGRRNKLVHGHWNFYGDKFEVENIEQAPAQKRSTQIVTEKSLLELASSYLAAGIEAEGCCGSIGLDRDIAKNTASTPDSGSPSS